jgi:hypothetical protein
MGRRWLVMIHARKLCVSFQINLKPSALKNELNAAIQFVKFAKRSRNLAVTNPSLNGTLENVKDMLSTFQEGTLKKINLDRNKKTTRNVQEGLPFRLDDLRCQTEDKKLLAAVSDKVHDLDDLQ